MWLTGESYYIQVVGSHWTVTLFSFPVIFSLIALASLKGLVCVNDCDESSDVALRILQSFVVENCNRLHYMLSLFVCHFVFVVS